MAVVIIGANVRGKPNFMPIAWCSIVEHDPPMISISASKNHYTNRGIIENETFSVNTPSIDMVKATDYIGIKSGVDIDKSDIFDVIYGDLGTAPMIKDSPLNLECKLIHTVKLDIKHDIFIGEIKKAYAEDKIIKNNIPDVERLNPLIFSMNDNNYWELGKHIGRAWSIGREFKSD
ncbi:MAG: flavin reductase family protein [Candidatus Lokiarchaeota archaeon]|nr:flavin reductase family protein [Candidatus Lokiarchaeota archaeon]MBD3199482.1 flavin reductase family protein [Candidatus Lokiarchaeota archaeon]